MAASSSAAAAAAEAPRWDEELCVPVNKIAKVMKKALPSNGKLSKQGKELIAQCISEFISYITGEASARCQREKRMTMNGEDVIWAMSTLGFDDYVEPLKLYLFKYRQYVNCNEMPAGTQSQFFAGITRGTPAGEALVVAEREGHGGVEENSATVKQGTLAKEGTLPEENSAMEEKGPPPECNSGSKKVPVNHGLTSEEETRKRGATLEENSGMKESAKQGTQLEDNSSTEEE